MSALDFISSGPRRLCDWYHGAIATRVEASPDQSESGAALVEFTVMMPLFFLIAFGIIEFGNIFFVRNNMENAAREAARTIAQQKQDQLTSAFVTSTLQSVCTNFLHGAGPIFPITYTTTPAAGPGNCAPLPPQNGQDVTVKITVPTGSSGSVSGASFYNYLGMISGTLKASVTMREGVTCQNPGTVSTTTYSCQ